MDPISEEDTDYASNTNRTLKEEPNRSNAALSTYFEENMDSIMKQEQKKKKKKLQKSKVWEKVQCIGFPFISVFCAVFVMVIWVISRNGSSTARETKTEKNDTVSRSHSCPFWELTGDGYCDDETNIPECGYDYDDCCQLQNDRSLCTNCTCHLLEDEVQLFKSQSCGDLSHHITNHLGNGVCDLNLNQAKYFFDVGDCCREFHKFEEMTCKFEEHYEECPKYTCIPSNNFCIAKGLGDGICQDYNNGPYCDYDLGDCCSKNNHSFEIGNSKNCCGCFCHLVHHDHYFFYFG